MGVTAQALHGAKICIIPRPENNYRPLALRRRSLMAVSGFILTAKAAALVLVLLLPATAELSTITNARILQLTNEERVSHGLTALTVNDKLSQAAAEKAQDMIKNDYFAHISPTGVTPWFWMQRNDYSYTVAGENLAIDFIQAEDVVDAWMASPSHRDNLLQPDYTETGIAVLTGEYQGGTSTVAVHMFGLPVGGARPSQSSALSARAPVTTEESEETPAAPTVAPALPAAPVNVPAVPSVTLLNPQATVQSEATVQVKANPGSIVHIQVNGMEVALATVDVTGLLQQSINLAHFEDGLLTVTAWAENEAGLTSKNSAVLKLDKDTLGPEIKTDKLEFLVSPATDAPMAMLVLPPGEFVKLTLEQEDQTILSAAQPLPDRVVFALTAGAVKAQVFDEAGNASVVGMVDLQPSIFTERKADFSPSSSRVNTMSRRLIIITALTILVLLLMAVLIKIHTQHPRMIAHASLVVLLAVIMLLI